MKWRGPIGGGAASGKMGSVVAARAKGGQYLRARTTPVNPATVFQQVVRNAVKALTSAWQRLDSVTRGNWDVYAANVKKTDRLGDQITVSGFNWFVGNNTPRVQAEFPIVTDAPTVFDLGNPDWSLVAPIGNITDNGTLGTLTLQSTITGVNGSSGFLALYVGRPFSAGRTFFKGPYQLAHSIVSNSSGNIPAGTYTFSSPFTASGIADADSANHMAFTLRLDRGDGRLSSAFQGFFQ